MHIKIKKFHIHIRNYLLFIMIPVTFFIGVEFAKNGMSKWWMLINPIVCFIYMAIFETQRWLAE